MSTLLRPDNRQRAEYVTFQRGYVCLRLLDTVTPAVRWFSHEQMMAVNPMVEIAPPMCIYPMPAMYPREVFLAAANYLLHRATMQVSVRVAVADGQVGLAA